MTKRPYNPLDKINLAKSIEAEVLSSEIHALSTTERIQGAGVYLLYYRGDYPAYSAVSAENSQSWEKPIYVGKAIPKGGRKGGMAGDVSAVGTALGSRLRKHAESIKSTGNLNLDDFVFRYIVLDDIWIPLGENILIETFRPLWNVALEGFGINAPGKGRLNQKRSPWDVVHPGRSYTAQLTGGGADLSAVLGRIDDHYSGRPLRPLPKKLKDAVSELENVDQGEE